MRRLAEVRGAAGSWLLVALDDSWRLDCGS